MGTSYSNPWLRLSSARRGCGFDPCWDADCRAKEPEHVRMQIIINSVEALKLVLDKIILKNCTVNTEGSFILVYLFQLNQNLWYHQEEIVKAILIN